MDYTTACYLFWISLGILLHTWVGYPVCLFVLERLLYRPVRKGPCEPSVSVLVLAFNEEEAIARKLDNLLALDYPRDKLEIVVASDGSFDKTCEVVRAYADRGVTLRNFPTRRGKPSVLNDVVPELKGEIVVLADTRQRFEPDILRRLLPSFADPEVGGVSGELVFEHPERAGFATGMDLYWRYEKWIRARESGIDSTIGATGAIFALRKSCFVPLPGETILDDVVLPLQIVRHGKRVVLEMGARAWDVLQSSWQREYARKARTLSGNFQILASFPRMAMGMRSFGVLGFEYLSHKVFRLLGPLCLAALFLANDALLATLSPAEPEYILYAAAYAIQVAFYLMAAVGGILHGWTLRAPLMSAAWSFLVMQAAVITGLLRFGSGRDDVLWEKAHALDPASSWQRVWRLIWDSTLFSSGFIFAFYLRYWGPPPREALMSYMQLFHAVDLWGLRLAIPMVMIIPVCVFYFFRVNETRTLEITPEYFLTLIKGVFYATVVLFLVMYVKRSALLLPMATGDGVQVVSFPTSILLLGFAVNCALIGGWRLVLLYYRWATEDAREERREILMLGRASPVLNAAVAAWGRIYEAIPLVDCGEALRRVAATLGRSRPDVILINAAAAPREAFLAAVAVADEKRLPVNLLPGDMELVLGHTPPRLCNYIPVLEPANFAPGEVWVVCKRLLDIAVGLLVLVPGVCCYVSMWMAGRLLGGGRIALVRVPRVGRKMRPVRVFRLRGTCGWPRWWRCGARWMVHGLNLVAGMVSLAGPRALLPRAAAALPEVTHRFVRWRPGIFSLDSVRVCREEVLDNRSAALIYYARNSSLSLDLQIFLQAWRGRMTRKAHLADHDEKEK